MFWAPRGIRCFIRKFCSDPVDTADGVQLIFGERVVPEPDPTGIGRYHVSVFENIIGWPGADMTELEIVYDEAPDDASCQSPGTTTRLHKESPSTALVASIIARIASIAHISPAKSNRVTALEWADGWR